MASCVYDKTGRQWEALRARGQASVALENLQMGTGQKDRDRYVQSPLLGAVQGKMPEKGSGETQGRIKGRKAEWTDSWKQRRGHS